MTQSFTEKLVQRDGGQIRLILATEQGKPCWFYVRLTPENYQAYKQMLKIKHMNIAEYGQILESDWGSYPPLDMIEFMRQKHDYETPSINMLSAE